MNRINGHGFKRVDFFANFHGAEFSGKCRTRAADDDDGGNQRAKFTGHRDGHGTGYKIHRAESFEFIGALESENQANEKGDERKNGKGANAGFHGLSDGLIKTDGLAGEWTDNRGIGGATGQCAERAEIGNRIENRNSDESKKVHECFAPSNRTGIVPLRIQCLLLVFEYFKDGLQPGEVHDFPNMLGQAVEDQPRTNVARSP